MKKEKFICITAIIFKVLFVLFFVWVFCSYIDINMHNKLNAVYGQFSFWNFFILMSKFIRAKAIASPR